MTEQLVRSAVDSGVDSPTADDFDRQLHRAVRERVGAARYDLWFPGRARFVLSDDRVLVGVGNLILQNVFQRGFSDVIRAAAVELLDRPVEVRYRIDPVLFRQIRAEQARVDEQARVHKSPKPPEPNLFSQLPAKPPVAKRRWRHLHEFVVGPCNRVAYAAATSTAEAPGEGPNPLVIHGPVGTGKTHLLEGIYAALRRRRPDARVLYVSAEDFTNRFVTALRFGKQGAFRRHFRTCDTLLLDDLHFLAKKRASQEEFLHTFDALLADGRQVVLTCDCHPRLNDDFGPELTDRLLGGAIWGLQPPDVDTRLALLRAKSAFKPKAHSLDPESDARERVPIPDEVLAFLAERLRGNVRELEGALHSLRHFARVTGRTIDCDLAREALGDLLRHAVRVVRVGDVDAAVCTVLRLPSGTLQGKERSWGVSHPRMIAVFLARKHTAASYGEISKHFGGKSHGTAVAAEKKVRQWLIDDEKLAAGGREWSVRELVERVERELLG